MAKKHMYQLTMPRCLIGQQQVITVQRALTADMMDENELVAYALLESIINEEDKETYDDKMEELVMRLNEDE